MHQGEYVFAQIMKQVVRYEFNQCVLRYHGGRGVRSLTCFDQFLAMAFGQLSFRESLRDICVCLYAHRQKLYHLGFRSEVIRTTLADANEHRDWRIYRDYAQVLIEKAKPLYTNDPAFNDEINGAVYVLDSTTIELCLSLFSWARVHEERSTIKLHLGLNLKGHIPSFFHLSDGNMSDVSYLDSLTFEPGAYYVMDRGYLDFKRLFRIHVAKAFFITRFKKGIRWQRLYSNKVNKQAGVRCDQTIRLTTKDSTKHYPEKLRRIKYVDKETNQAYVFLTNDFRSKAETIALLYKNRWQVELFFKWIKQHLSVKTFWGRSANAVKTQICIALCTYLLVAITKKNLRIDRSSYEILQILSVSLFDKKRLVELISEAPLQTHDENTEKQLNLLGI